MNIRKLREDLGMSQSQFSEKFGINVNTLQNWEQERYRTPDYVFNLLFKIFDLESKLKAEREAFDKWLELVSK